MRLILIGVALLVAVSIILEQYVFPLVIISLAILVGYGLRGRVEGAVYDERNFRISEMASRRTVQLMGAVAGVGGLVLVGVGQMGVDGVELVGIAMAIFASALMLCYLAFHGYYRRKFGELLDAE